MIIYRLDLSEPLEEKPLFESQCVIVHSPLDVAVHFFTWVGNWGWAQAVRTALKVLSCRRVLYYCVAKGRHIIQSGWANLGFCRHYPVEPDSVVLGTLYTRPEYRGRGISTAAKSRVLAYLYRKGYRRFYADTISENIAAQRTSEKLGFQRIA